MKVAKHMAATVAFFFGFAAMSAQAATYQTQTVFDSFTQNNSFFTSKYKVTNTTTGGAPYYYFGVVKVTFRHIESITPPTFPGTGVAEGLNPPSWIPSYTLVEDNPEVDIYDIEFTSINGQNFNILPGYQEQFYFTVRGPLGETPVVQTLVDSMATAYFHSYSGSTDDTFVEVLDFNDAPPPLTPPVLNNMSISGTQICFDISNMTIGALITVETNTNITNPSGWNSVDSFTAASTSTNRCEPIGNSSVFRAKAQ